MPRFLADENFHNDVLAGLLRREPALDVVRAQDVGLTGADDPAILEWAAANGRVVLTHDVTTMTRHAYDRVRAGLAMPGVLEVSDRLPIGRAVEEALITIECSLEGEWEGQVRYLSL